LLEKLFEGIENYNDKTSSNGDKQVNLLTSPGAHSHDDLVLMPSSKSHNTFIAPNDLKFKAAKSENISSNATMLLHKRPYVQIRQNPFDKDADEILSLETASFKHKMGRPLVVFDRNF